MTPILSEQLRPTEFADLIQPSAMVERLERMAEQRMPMNMLFYGQPGVGKTSAARILLNKLDADYCEINGSMETGIEHVRKNIEMFCVSMSMFSAVKVCFIDECEYLSMNAQASLRGLIEKCDSRPLPADRERHQEDASGSQISLPAALLRCRTDRGAGSHRATSASVPGEAKATWLRD